MSKVSIRLGTLTSIGDAVRAKKGTAEQIPVANLASEIESIQTGTDTSKDTVTADTMLEGVTAHNASGEQITGTIPTYDGAVTGGLILYVEREIIGYSYNGIDLPTPPEYDTEKYPYAFISYLGGVVNGNNVRVAEFVVSEKPVLYDSNGSLKTPFLNGGEYVHMILCNKAYADLWGWQYTGEWVVEEERIGGNTHFAGNEFWSNHDILCKDSEEVFLSASEPIPIYEVSTYDYNGMVLQDIDGVWTDKEKYPYAVVFYGGIVVLSNQAFVEVSTNSFDFPIGTLVSAYQFIDDKWETAEGIEDIELDGSLLGVPEESLSVIWSSADILRLDGTVAQATTEPVPSFSI